MCFLGFAAGLPYALIFSTLTAWLTESSVTRASIGFFTWIYITYSVKVLWSPIVDRVPLPILTRLIGQRRSWIVFAQFIVIVGLVGMSFCEPKSSLLYVALFALLVAIGSATHDIALDAWRIESTETERQAAMSAVYVFSYRVAMITSGAGALFLASSLPWGLVYKIMAVLMAVGTLAILSSPEPDRRHQEDVWKLESRVEEFLFHNQHLPHWLRNIIAWFIGAVICPFVDFFRRYAKQAVLFLFIIATYRICEVSLASMAVPYYLDMGYSKIDIGKASGVWGLIMTIVGGIIGGVIAAKVRLVYLLLIGACLSAITNLLYITLSFYEPDLSLLTFIIAIDNLCGGFAATVFIAWMSGLTSENYTATQYALFSSLMTFFGKVIGGFGGLVVDYYGYVDFFIYATALGLPAILCALLLIRQNVTTHATTKGELFVMRLFLFLLFPFIEVYLFIQVGDHAGYAWAFLGLVLSFVVGINLFRFTGARSVQNLMSSFATAQASPDEMGSVMAKMLAAVLLMIPGYLTDVFALFILFPPTRSLLMLLILKRLMKSGSVKFGFNQSGSNNPFQQPFSDNQGDIIEGEATEVKSDRPSIERSSEDKDK